MHRRLPAKPLNHTLTQTRVAPNPPRAPARVAHSPPLRANTLRGYAQHLFTVTPQSLGGVLTPRRAAC